MSEITLTRTPNWPERLAEMIDSRRFEPFQWGSNDCCIFAADTVLAMTGTDLARSLRGYKTERGALSRISKAGGMRGFATGLAQKLQGFASRGDVVLAVVEGRETFGIVSGNGHWCGPGADGLVFRPMSEVETVFGI